MRNLAEAKHEFTSVPVCQEQSEDIAVISAKFEQLLDDVYGRVPEGANRTAGTRKLLEAKQTFVQAISHDWKQNAKSA